MAIMMHSPATLTPTCKTETLGCSRGLFPGLWVVTWPVGRYRARDPWAIPGPGPCATQTTGCASERRCGPSLQAGQGDSDGPPRAGCRRHPVWNGMYLRAAASWQCVLWDAPVAATVSPGSAPPNLRWTARTGSAVCAHGHRDRTGHHDNTPPPPSQVEARLSTVIPIRPTVRLGSGHDLEKTMDYSPSHGAESRRLGHQCIQFIIARGSRSRAPRIC